MLNEEIPETELLSISDRDKVAVVCCGEHNGKHSDATYLLAKNCYLNGLYPHIFFFSPNTCPLLLNKKFITKQGFPVLVGGSTPQANFELVQLLGSYGSRAWMGIAPPIPESYSVTREGVLYLWKQKPARDIVYNNIPMEDALVNWAFDYLKFAKLVVCKTSEEKILYPREVPVISEVEALKGQYIE